MSTPSETEREAYWRPMGGAMPICRLEVEDPEGYFDATVTWDGCVNLAHYYNGDKNWPKRNPDDVDGMHICDLEDLIKRLEALREVATRYFMAQGYGRWPGL